MRNSLKLAMCGIAVIAAFFVFAEAIETVPQVTDVDVKQGPGSRLVTIKYKLDTYPAVVTLDVKTGATGSIGGEHICNAEGAVWRKVTENDKDDSGWCTITWHPELSWTGESGNGFKAENVQFEVTAWPLDNTPDYMVLDISEAAQPNTQRYYPAVDFLPGSQIGQRGAVTNNPAYKTTMLVMRKIMAKDVTWTIGSVEDVETARTANDERTFQVTLENNYYIGIFEITQSQWSLIATNSTAKARFQVEGAMRPMDKVCFNEIHNTHRVGGDGESVSAANLLNPAPDSFLGLLSLKTGIDFNLPSEAEWEFAARAGHGTGYWGDGSPIMNTDEDENLDKLARYKGNDPGNGATTATLGPKEGGTAIVGSYNPNDWGLYDMHGNVMEWCLDWFQSSSGIAPLKGKVNISASDPSKRADGSDPYNGLRILRGAYYDQKAGHARSARRNTATSDNTFWAGGRGFRVLCKAGLK